MKFLPPRLPSRLIATTTPPLLLPKMSQQYSNSNKASTRDRGRRERNDSPTVVLSKSLSWLLRHGLDQSGLHVRNDGYVRLDELLTLPKFRQYTLAQIREVVDTNDKQRFTITSLETPDGPKDFIRANQGHSIKAIQVEMTPITSAEEYPTIVHGTNAKAWALIAKDKNGLSRMKRNHIHFATGLIGEEGVISGMRHSCTHFIYIDFNKALKDGVKFFKSENGVVLTEGVKGEGHLPKEYFSKVVARNGEVLWPLKSDEKKENAKS